MTRRVYLSQINNTYGDNAFLPYSTAMLWSAARVHADITDSFSLAGHLLLREPLRLALERMAEPHVLGVSCYLWNWRYNLEFMAQTRRLWPSCVIICGGPEVPDHSEGFLQQHPFIDYLVHGEAEITFAELLRCIRDGTDPSTVSGISYAKGNETVKTMPRPRAADPSQFPSPYLDGTMDDIMRQYPSLHWHASQETHRGCPYSCTFCDWGSAVYTKVRQFDDQRLLAEMEWFGSRQIDLLYNCDANYGLFGRDRDLTRALVQTKARWGGHPSKFRAAYAKKSDDKVFEIAKMLNDAGMSKGVTLSTQSMDPHTLHNIKRTNIAMDAFAPLAARYRAAGIPTYTELIIGLPGETLQSFYQGIETLLPQHLSLHAAAQQRDEHGRAAEQAWHTQRGDTIGRHPWQRAAQR
jgi:tRNA A37 methylthiotransferase MiaB